MKSKKMRLETLSNLLFYLGVLTSIGTITYTYWVRRSLPKGMCPVSQNYSLYMISIGLLAVSIIMSFISKKSYK